MYREGDDLFVTQLRNGKDEQLYAGAIFRNVGYRYTDGVFTPIDVIGQSYRNRRDGKPDFNIPLFLENIKAHTDGLERLKAYPHPNLVTYYGMKEGVPLSIHENLKEKLKTGQDTFVYYEYVEGENLYKQLEKAGSFNALAGENKTEMLEGLFDGIDHFHKVSGMVHKDITTRNVIVAKRDNPKHRLVLGDLELCEYVGQPYSLFGAMSPNFSPMELLLIDQEADVRSDIASLAATLSQILVWEELSAVDERWVKKIDHIATENLNMLNRIDKHQEQVKHLRETYRNTSELHEDVLTAISMKYGTEIAQILAKAAAFDMNERYENIETFKQAFMSAFRTNRESVKRVTSELDLSMMRLGFESAAD